MSFRFWASSKPVPALAPVDELAWFEHSIHGGVVILGIFRDAIALSPSPYVKRIAEKTLGIIRGIAIAGNRDATLRINFQKLGEAAAAVTAKILQSYLESAIRDGWPGSQLQNILEDLIKTLDTIEVWISSGQARNSFVRRKCVQMIKQFHERLSVVLEHFELASLLQSYTVLPFIKKMVEEYAHIVEADAEKLQLSMKVGYNPPRALPQPGMVEGDFPNQDCKQIYREEEGIHDALRLKIRLMLRLIEEEERGRHTPLNLSAAANQVATGLHQCKVQGRLELQDLRGKFVPEVGKLAVYANMEQDAEEMLYNMLMTRFSNVAVFGSNAPPPILGRPRLLSLSPSYSLVGNVQGQHAYQGAFRGGATVIKDHVSDNNSERASRLLLDKPLPSLEQVDTPESQTRISRLQHAYERNRPLNHMIQGTRLRGVSSLPPGAMPPKISTAYLLPYASELTDGSGRLDSLPSDPTRPERSLIIAPPLSFGPKKCLQTWKPSLPDVDEEDKGSSLSSPDRPAPDVIPRTEKGKEKDLVGSSDTTRPADASSSTPSLSISSDPGGPKIPRSCRALPPGAMPPRLSSWPPPSAFKEERLDHRDSSPVPTVNSIPVSPINADKNLPPVHSNSSLDHLPERDLNVVSTRRPTLSSLDNKEESTSYHLPPLTVVSPITLAPLLGVDPDVPPPPPPKQRPRTVGPGYEYLRKSSPHMQRYVESLADRIWGEKE